MGETLRFAPSSGQLAKLVRCRSREKTNARRQPPLCPCFRRPRAPPR